MRNLILFFVLLISACSPISTNYYSLDHAENVAPAISKDKHKINGVQLIMDKIPMQYDRPQLLVQDKTIAPKVYVLNESLWVSPLQDQIQRSLANDIAHYLGVPVVNGIPNLHNIQKYIVRIVNFDMTLNQGSYIEANWSSRLDDGEPQLCKASVTIDKPAKDVDALIDTQKDALRAMAAIIALHNDIDNTEIRKKILSYNLGCT